MSKRSSNQASEGLGQFVQGDLAGWPTARKRVPASACSVTNLRPSMAGVKFVTN
jgi:hypothetical protein